jgi:hypothetical protein
MKTRKLSHRAILLLLVVDGRTRRDVLGKLECFWIPKYDPEYVNAQKYDENGKLPPYGLTDVSVFGSDALVLKSLERKGLIRRPDTNMSGKYMYYITDDGKDAIEEYRKSK